MIEKIKEQLGKDGQELLSYKSVFPKDTLHLPGPDYVDRVFSSMDRHPAMMRNLQTILNNGRLGGTGFLSISSRRPGNRA